MKLIPRWAHHLYAVTLGYFWTPCPLCGTSFGGHQWPDRSGKPSGIPVPGKQGTQRAICPDCTKAGRGVPTGAYLGTPVISAPGPDGGRS